MLGALKMNRLNTLRMIWIIATGILLFRLIYLQGLQGRTYRNLAEKNRLRLIVEEAPRGLVVDRQGVVLATNQTFYRVAIIPQELEDLSSIVETLSLLTHQPIDRLQENYRKARSLPFLPATVLTRLSKDQALHLEEERWRMPGLLVKPELIRSYPLGSTAAHLLGYVSQPNPQELGRLKSLGLSPAGLVGRYGLEQYLETDLRGQAGGRVVEVDHRARQVRVVDQQLPRAGQPVSLTIDASLQTLIEQSFQDQPGACVVLDPWTGEILAMVSVPTFSPAVFSMGETKTIRQLLEDINAPLMNRATLGVYTPGSILKLISATAALEHQLINPSTKISCPGSWTLGDRTFHCWNRDGHGVLSLSEAIMHSCNVYFLQVGRKLGAVRLLKTLDQAGCSHRTGWPLGEAAGHLPSRYLTDGEVAMLAIGQGEVLLTPLQAAVMVSAFANGGQKLTPWVVSKIKDRSVNERHSLHPLGWSAKTIETVRRGMIAAVGDPSGTAHRAYDPNVSVAGKTGTAQTHLPGQTHGWFVGFCPVESPRAAMAIVTEHGGSGGDLPAEIARSICEYVVAAGI